MLSFSVGQWVSWIGSKKTFGFRQPVLHDARMRAAKRPQNPLVNL